MIERRPPHRNINLENWTMERENINGFLLNEMKGCVWTGNGTDRTIDIYYIDDDGSVDERNWIIKEYLIMKYIEMCRSAERPFCFAC